MYAVFLALFLIVLLSLGAWTAAATRVRVRGLAIMPDQSVVASVSAPSVADPTLWAGKRAAVVTRSLGTFTTTVRSVMPPIIPIAGSYNYIVSTAPGAYSGPATYNPDAGDYMIISGY